MLPGPHSPQLSIYLNRTYPWTYKGGGLEFFYQFTITPIQISDPIIFVLSHNKKKYLAHLLLFYFIMILFYVPIIPWLSNNAVTGSAQEKKGSGSRPWPMTISLRYTDFFKTKYVFSQIIFIFFRLFSCQNLMNRSEIKIF